MDHIDKSIINKQPGTIPPKKIFFTDTPAVTPYIIAGKLGGNNKPNDPETVIKPIENDLVYPSFNNNGNNNPPNANIVTPEPPVNAVKKPHNKIIIIGIPPGIHPNNSLKTLTSLSEALLSASK